MTSNPTPPSGVAEPADLHNAIMNIECVVPKDANVNQALSYKYGHRDARHAAAELVAASQAASHGAPAEPVAMPQYWSVVVAVDGRILVSIGNDWLSGESALEEHDEKTIVGAAQHLLAFVGYGLPPCDFDPDARPLGAETVAPDTSAVWSAIADYVMATEALQRRRAEGHLMNAEWIDSVKSASEAVDRAILAALASPAEAPSTEPAFYINAAIIDPATGKIGKHVTSALTWDNKPSQAWATPVYLATPVQPVPASPAVEVPSEPMQINGQPATAHSLLAALVDIHEDSEWNSPENRTYVGSAYNDMLEMARKFLAAHPAAGATAPIDMVLHCPACGLQHVDEAEEERDEEVYEGDQVVDSVIVGWDNPPHRSHLCHGCGHIWRPADVPTNGVQAVKTTGKADSPIAAGAVHGLTDERTWRDKAKAAWLAEEEEGDQLEAYDRGWKDRGTLAATTAALPASNEVKP